MNRDADMGVKGPFRPMTSHPQESEHQKAFMHGATNAENGRGDFQKVFMHGE